MDVIDPSVRKIQQHS